MIFVFCQKSATEAPLTFCYRTFRQQKRILRHKSARSGTKTERKPVLFASQFMPEKIPVINRAEEVKDPRL
jgi:hypothetical protein